MLWLVTYFINLIPDKQSMHFDCENMQVANTYSRKLKNTADHKEIPTCEASLTWKKELEISNSTMRIGCRCDMPVLTWPCPFDANRSSLDITCNWVIGFTSLKSKSWTWTVSSMLWSATVGGGISSCLFQCLRRLGSESLLQSEGWRWWAGDGGL